MIGDDSYDCAQSVYYGIVVVDLLVGCSIVFDGYWGVSWIGWGAFWGLGGGVGERMNVGRGWFVFGGGYQQLLDVFDGYWVRRGRGFGFFLIGDWKMGVFVGIGGIAEGRF